MPCSRSIVPLPSPGIGRNLAPIGVGSAGFLRGRALHQSAGRSPWNRVSSAIADAWLSASVQRPRRLQPRLRRSGAAVRSITSISRRKSAVSYDGNDRPSPLLSSSKMAPAETFKSISCEAEVRPVLTAWTSHLNITPNPSPPMASPRCRLGTTPLPKTLLPKPAFGRGGGGSRGKPTRPDERA